MKTTMTLDEMKACLDIWDQTIGCNNCSQAWWAENATEYEEDFHADGCPLKGNRAAHEDFLDYWYIDQFRDFT